MPYARGAGGCRIWWEALAPDGVAEDRPPVVLVQGLGLSSRFWFDLPARLAADTRRPRRVIVLDNRGSGRSDRPRGPYRMRSMAGDVVAVLDAAGVERAVVVGISMGGMIAQHVALRHPRRVAGLVLVATTPGLPHGRLPRPHTLALLLALGLRADGGRRALPRLLLPRAARSRARELFARWPDAFLAEPMPPRAFVAQLAAIAAHSTGFALHRIDVPTVVVTGDEDVLVPPKNSERIARRIAGSVLEVLPGVAHGVPMTDEDVVRRALETLEALPGDAGAARRGLLRRLGRAAARRLGL